MSTQSPDLLIVGGGAAGLIAAGKALEEGLSVMLFEPNDKLGRKLSITGKGRCNLTNNCSPADFLQNVTKNPRFLYSAIYGFTPADCMALFEGLGVPLKTERGRRVFPVSDRALDIVDALARYAKGAKIVKARVDSVLTEEGRAVGVVANGREYRAEAILLATGGVSYPRTGSTGDGFRMARALAHTVTPLLPSLVPLESPDGACKRMQGLSLKNVALTLLDKEGHTVYRDFGEMLFTHFGISGPMVLSASAHLRSIPVSEVTASIDLKPALDEKTLDQRLLSDLAAQKNRAISNILSGLLPSAMIPVCLERTEIPPAKVGNAVTKEERKRLLGFLKGFRLPLSAFRPVDEAIVTSGGIDTRQVEPKSMMSRLVENLYFAGEILDVDAYTGGYNLQIAFATAVAAARAIAKKRKEKTMKIAIDGPSGAGKSSLAKAIAKRLSIIYVDTGALYRSIGLYMKNHGINPHDEAAVSAVLPAVSLSLLFQNGEQHILLCGEDVGDKIRTPEMSMYASAVSALPSVRAFLLDTQRSIAEKNSVIMDGRDIGTVILPDAEVKIFLTASSEARARRRTDELLAKGVSCTYEEVLADMITRDKNDSTRKIAPAVPAEDAVFLDNSLLTVEETIDRALAIIKEKGRL